MNRVSLKFLSDFQNSRLAGLCVREIASDFFDDTVLSEIELAVVEAVNNCIGHACTELYNQQIVIDFCLNDDRLLVEINDKGKSFDSDLLDYLNSDFVFDTTDFANLPEGGMGLKIIKHYMDEVTYQNVNQINCWRLVKYLTS